MVAYLLSISNTDKAHLPDFHLKYGILKDTPLHISCRCGHIQTIYLLLQATNHELDSNYLIETNADGLTAFHLSVYHEHIHVIQCFIDTLDESTLHKITSTKDTVHNETPLIYAINKGYDVSFIQILASVSDLNLSSVDVPPLVVATKRNDIEIAQALLFLDIDINQTDDLGHTAISIAARNGYADLCELLASHGADLMITTQRGGTPLQKAKRYKHLNVVKILEKYGG